MENIGTIEYWNNFKKTLQKIFPFEIYEAFLSDSKFKSFADGCYEICVNDDTSAMLFNTQFKSSVEEYFSKEIGSKIIVHAMYNKNMHNKESDQTSAWFKNHLPISEFTFETFVEGSSNKIAVGAAKGISFENDNENFYSRVNPLFIYGNSGLGKTHLLNAIGNQILKNNPNLKVIYISADDFVKNYVSALGYKKSSNNFVNNVDTMINNYLKSDVLIIDDIQAFNSKTETSNTFFNIFNKLVNSGKKIIIAADKSPDQLKGIENRLVTRFNQGLSISINNPETELAIAYINQKIKLNFSDNPNLIIQNDVIEYFATNFGSNFRSLLGILNNLSMTLTLFPINKVDLNYIKKNMSDLNITNPKMNFDNYLNEISNYFQINDSSMICGRSRIKEIALARHCVVYLARKYLKMPFKAIGANLDGRDHSTIMNSDNKIKELFKKDSNLKKIITDLEKKLMLTK